jgi:3-(3-hydroxy-phenyl)propionate hydroxylase
MVRPGAAALDAPMAYGWLLNRIGGTFTCLWLTPQRLEPVEITVPAAALARASLPVRLVEAPEDPARARYGAEQEEAFYLLRPDQHVAARWRVFSAEAVKQAVARATASTDTRH